MQLAGAENALQFIPHLALDELRNFIRHPSKKTASCLRYIPALRSLLLYEYRVGEPDMDKDILGLCSWLYVRAHAVYTTLKTHEVPAVEASSTQELPEDWTKVDELVVLWVKSG